MNYQEFRMTVGGREVVIETGKYTEQANGSCVVRCGETAVMDKSPKLEGRSMSLFLSPKAPQKDVKK